MKNGLDQLLEMMDRFDLPFPVTRFSLEYVERSETCRIWVNAYEELHHE